MARVAAVFKPNQYPGTPNEKTRQDLADLFEQLMPNTPDPQFDKRHAGIAIAAHNPRLALALAKLSALIAVELPWCRRQDLRELAIQSVNLHFNSDYSFKSRVPNAASAGVGPDMLAALPNWRESALFTEEQKLVIEYAQAVASGKVEDDLFGRMIDAYGEKESVECTSLVAFWSFWALFLNATNP